MSKTNKQSTQAQFDRVATDILTRLDRLEADRPLYTIAEVNARLVEPVLQRHGDRLTAIEQQIAQMPSDENTARRFEDQRLHIQSVSSRLDAAEEMVGSSGVVFGDNLPTRIAAIERRLDSLAPLENLLGKVRKVDQQRTATGAAPAQPAAQSLLGTAARAIAENDVRIANDEPTFRAPNSLKQHPAAPPSQTQVPQYFDRVASLPEHPVLLGHDFTDNGEGKCALCQPTPAPLATVPTEYADFHYTPDASASVKVKAFSGFDPSIAAAAVQAAMKVLKGNPAPRRVEITAEQLKAIINSIQDGVGTAYYATHHWAFAAEKITDFFGGK